MQLHGVVALSLLLHQALATCPQPEPAFLLPDFGKHRSTISSKLQNVERTLQAIVGREEYDTSSFAIQVTSPDSTLWSSSHTAIDKDLRNPGATRVNASSVFRIASITKTFTVLSLLQQHDAGRLDLDHSVDRYLTALQGPQNGSIQWKHITLRQLASQLSGPRGGSSTILPDPVKVGLPPQNNSMSLPDCSSPGSKPCTQKDLVDVVKQLDPLFNPNTKSTYSNIAFELLGLVLEKATGRTYEDLIRSSILAPLGMNATTFVTPPKSTAVLPKDNSWYYDIDQGVSKPTGGLYSTASDLSLYMRYILNHYSNLVEGFNWLQPVSFSAGLNTYYGMPWEIFRTQALNRERPLPVTFFTKGGSVPGYSTMIALVPDYGVGITILTGGNPTLLPQILEALSKAVIQAIDDIVIMEQKEKYVGDYTAGNINSSLSIAYDATNGLFVSKLVSNGTDMLAMLREIGQLGHGKRLVIVPTKLYVDNENKAGEKWQVTPVLPQREGAGVWDDFCVAEISGPMYDGRLLYELVFWEDEVELTGLRVRLQRIKGQKRQGGLLLQWL